MIKLRDIKKFVSHLPAKDLAKFRTWFLNFDVTELNKKFEQDVKLGKLGRVPQKNVGEF